SMVLNISFSMSMNNVHVCARIMNDVQEIFEQRSHDFVNEPMSKTAERRQQLKNALIAAAERTIETHGLGGLKARALAYRVGCAVGAIYNVVTDLDDLVFEVNSRTLAALERDLAAAEQTFDAAGEPAAVDRLV